LLTSKMLPGRTGNPFTRESHRNFRFQLHCCVKPRARGPAASTSNRPGRDCVASTASIAVCLLTVPACFLSRRRHSCPAYAWAHPTWRARRSRNQELTYLVNLSSFIPTAEGHFTKLGVGRIILGGSK